ncbi:MAG: glycosyltransferase family 4 protein [Gemmataceae bacterium]
MRILMTLETTFPPHIRVEKEMRSLSALGHDLHLVAYGKRGQPRREHVPGLGTVHRVRFPVWLRPFRLLYGGRWPYLRFWLPRVRRIADDVCPDAIHVHDLPMAWVGYRVGRHFRIPLVLDFHENYPGFLVWAAKTFHPFIRASIDYPGWNHYEALAVRWADRIIVVDPTNQERLTRLYAVPPERCVVVGNSPDLDHLLPLLANAQARIHPDPTFVTLLYIGGIDAGRGIQTVLHALSLLPCQVARSGRPATLRFVIVGDGPYRPKLEKLARQFGVADRVHFEGFQPFHRLPDFIAAADIGVVPHVKDPLTQTTMPNKIFDYMLGGLPILVSDCAPLVRVAQRGPCGDVFASEDAASCAAATQRLVNTLGSSDFGQRGHELVQTEYNWARDTAQLRDVLSRLPGAHGNLS